MSTPTVPQFEHEIGERIGRGDLAGAEAAAAGCRAAWPSERAGWLFGSIAALLEDKKELALALVEERLAADTGDAQCLLQKAECLLALGNRDESLRAADAAAAGTIENAAALDAVGEFMAHAGDYRRALVIYDRAVAAAPGEPTVRAKRADVQRILGNLDLAAADYEAVLAISPTAPKALKGLVDLRRQTAERNYLTALQTALAGAPAGSTDAAILNFGLAKTYEDMGDYAASWAHLTAANRLERARIDYQPEQDRAFLERMIAAFPDAGAAGLDTTGERPIFIVGLPRTGTTLIERIIGSHSQVHAAGEVNALAEAVDVAIERAAAGAQSVDGERFSAILRGLDGKLIADEYLARMRTQRGDRPHFTDKLLTNFLYCGLIMRAFPQARIVHATRHPLAACYAIFRTRFARTYPFAYDLTDLAEFYLGYHRLMAHWHQVLPGRILDLAYEELVKAQEPTTRRLLQYLDLPFEATCLEFHRNPEPVKTTSLVQVRQPLYDSSLNAWQHYAAELEPLRARLQSAGIPID